MDPARLVLIRVGGLPNGSGYLIGPQLVLTSLHVVCDSAWRLRPGVDVRVGHSTLSPPLHERAARVCWPAPRGYVPGSSKADVALLWLDEPVELGGCEPVRWGRPLGKVPLPYEGGGFPLFAENGGEAQAEYLRGELPLVSTSGLGPAGRGWVLDTSTWPESSRTGSPWAGTSGSAIFCHGRLVGIVAEADPALGHRRLHAEPAHHLFDELTFTELLERHSDHQPPLALEDVGADGPIGPVEVVPPFSRHAHAKVKQLQEFLKFPESLCLPIIQAARLKSWLTDFTARDDEQNLAVNHLQGIFEDSQMCADLLNRLGRFDGQLNAEEARKVALRAGFPVGILYPHGESPITFSEIIEHALRVRRTPYNRPGPPISWDLLARLLAILVRVRGGEDIPEPLRSWRPGPDFLPVLEEHWKRSGLGEPRDEFRLVLALETDVNDEVIAVNASLLYAGIPQGRFKSHGKTPRAMVGDVVQRASEVVGAAGETLVHVDVAAPASYLINQHPADQQGRQTRLGVDYQVTPRWDGLLRLHDDRSIAQANGRKLLNALEQGAGPVIKLVPGGELDYEQLDLHLMDCTSSDGVWLAGTSTSGWEDLVDELLIHTPAIIWQDPGPESSLGYREDIKSTVERHWDGLPVQMSRLYQAHKAHLIGKSPEHECGALETVRIAWHDQFWQEFCERHEGRVFGAPIPTTFEENV
ncbi:hypothetical protein KNE206_71310 [Kitasatospora sp. NE20-6]|uniref:trypsin-like serine protease n=1 Tax=Kitasatospora sp. NE20-6 TaxID=2859066 RepID=UPI0034DC9F2E